MTRFISHHMVAAAQAYALADRSDPFTLARCHAHLRNGVASIDATYSADTVEETRTLPDGREYHVTAYRNITRP